VRELGSGFVISEDGRILTNNHVVSGSNQVEVTLPDQTTYKAQILVRDPQNDLALIKINPKKKLTVLRLGNSDNLQVGQKVLAIGNPYGFELTLTTGVISSIGRNIQADANTELQSMIQTDASINSGNSGGPLLDSQGNVIGINTAIFSQNGGSVGIGFAMPINQAKSMLEDYASGRSFARPRIGVSVLYVAGDWAEALDLPASGGLLVQGVQRGSPAERAGLKGAKQAVVIGNQEVGVGGDLIVSIDGKKADRPDAITRALARKRPGDVIDVIVLRGGKQLTLKVTLGEASDTRV
jgi:putative serine protease PepD